MELVTGAGVEAVPMERHNCCKLLALCFQDKFGKYKDSVVHLRLKPEACSGQQLLEYEVFAADDMVLIR